MDPKLGGCRAEERERAAASAACLPEAQPWHQSTVATGSCALMTPDDLLACLPAPRRVLTYQLQLGGGLLHSCDGLGHGGGVVLGDLPVAVDEAVHKAVARLDLQAGRIKAGRQADAEQAGRRRAAGEFVVAAGP